MRDVIALPARAAMYLRSSKDRSDVSPAAQRHTLEQLARSRSLTIATTFEDAVESGATEDRPGFLELLRQVKDPRRGWTALLVYDTSRIARRRYIAQAFKHDCKKRGITIHYAMLPADLDPVADIVLQSSLEAYDEVTSMMARAKGLAGMAQNVRQGFRAGGRAPLGYQLRIIPTGAIREGKPVTKHARRHRMERAHLRRAHGLERARRAGDRAGDEQRR
jgi:site-specific DNA recombinase